MKKPSFGCAPRAASMTDRGVRHGFAPPVAASRINSTRELNHLSYGRQCVPPPRSWHAVCPCAGHDHATGRCARRAGWGSKPAPADRTATRQWRRAGRLRGIAVGPGLEFRYGMRLAPRRRRTPSPRSVVPDMPALFPRMGLRPLGGLQRASAQQGADRTMTHSTRGTLTTTGSRQEAIGEINGSSVDARSVSR
jgi:hypothetical protein